MKQIVSKKIQIKIMKLTECILIINIKFQYIDYDKTNILHFFKSY